MNYTVARCTRHTSISANAPLHAYLWEPVSYMPTSDSSKAARVMAYMMRNDTDARDHSYVIVQHVEPTPTRAIAALNDMVKRRYADNWHATTYSKPIVGKPFGKRIAA